jgi:hypothetical protein
MGYSECVQECIRFVNNNTQIMPASPVIGAQGMTGCLSPATAAALTGGAASDATVMGAHQNNSIDQSTRKRLISNLMRQFQSINPINTPSTNNNIPSPSSPSPSLHATSFPSQINTHGQFALNMSREQHLMSKSIKTEPQQYQLHTSLNNHSPSLNPNFTLENLSNQISSPVNFNQTMPSNDSSTPSSPTHTQICLSDNNPSSSNANTRNNFRRSSVSPISSSSSSTSSSSSNLSNFTNENAHNTNNNNDNTDSHQNINLSVSESSSSHVLENSEKDHDMLNNSSSQSPKLFDTSSSQYDQNVWRPW